MKKYVLLFMAGTTLVSCNSSNKEKKESTTTELKREVFKLQGDSVMDESFSINPDNGDLYIGSANDGSIQKISGGTSTWFYPAETTNPKPVFGTAVDASRNRLWVVNADLNNPMSGHTGVRVFDLNTKAVLKTLLIPKDGKPHGLNDLVLDKDGNAYITDSSSPIIYKADSAMQGIQVFVTDPIFSVNPNFLNLQGIDITPTGKYLIATAANSGFDSTRTEGGLWRIGLANKKVTRVNVPNFEGGDGLAFAPDGTLYKMGRNKGLARLTFTNDFADATVQRFTSPEVMGLLHNAPNALRIYGGRVYVAPGQTDRVFPPGNPNYKKPFDPFEIIAVPLKDIN